MTGLPYVLMISPNAPPKHNAEAIQVRRILAELDARVRGRLVTTALRSGKGWDRDDPSLALTLHQFDVYPLRLPVHALTSRLVMSHRLRRWHVPDAERWILGCDREVIRTLPRPPDIIYSRSQPFSAALLAYRLKQRLHIPWIMHLSDPWVDNPARPHSPLNASLEAQCFMAADRITLTTERLAEHYRQQYPGKADAIGVSPNMLPELPAPGPVPAREDNILHIVFAGALYGERTPAPFLRALEALGKEHPEMLTRLQVDFYGHAQGESLRLLEASPHVRYHGAVDFAAAIAAQRAADVLLSLVPDRPHFYYDAFLPCKVQDIMALGKPILSLAPAGSTTEAVCRDGYGWSLPPSGTGAIAACLRDLLSRLPELRAWQAKPPPEAFHAAHVAETLVSQIVALTGKSPVPGAVAEDHASIRVQAG